jgi:acyl-coenzyme A synthetase/AMP-(fatty) acid ligase
VAVEMLTSGTTGPPKRVPLGYEMLTRVLLGAKYYEGNADQTPRLRSGAAIVNAPLVHLGGLFRVLQCLNDGRSFCLLERFTVEDWADAVRRHRPRTASLVPAALRMVLDADLDPDDLRSIRSVVSGTAPLAPETADAFGVKYGIPCWSRTRPPSSAAASPAGTWPTISDSGRPSAAAWAARTRAASCASSTPAAASRSRGAPRASWK